MTKKNNSIQDDAMLVLQQRQALESDDADIEKPSAITSNGWVLVDNNDLPTKGKFYREVWVKPFDVKTVREVSSVDPNNALATLKGMRDILYTNCYIIDLNGNKIDGSHLKRADVIAVLLVIRAITYVDDVTINLAKSTKCSVCGEEITKIECDGANVLDWPTKLDEVATIDDNGNILYKNFKFHLPTVDDVYMFITLLLSDDPKMKLDETTKADASALLYICDSATSIPELHKALIKSSSSLYGMSLKDIAVFHKFVQFLDSNIGIEPSIDTQCPKCRADIKIPFSLGLADICLATVEDF